MKVRKGEVGGGLGPNCFPFPENEPQYDGGGPGQPLSFHGSTAAMPAAMPAATSKSERRGEGACGRGLTGTTGREMMTEARASPRGRGQEEALWSPEGEAGRAAGAPGSQCHKVHNSRNVLAATDPHQGGCKWDDQMMAISMNE